MIAANLPGADLIANGLDDLAAGRETPEALLVAIGAVHLMPDRRSGRTTTRHGR